MIQVKCPLPCPSGGRTLHAKTNNLLLLTKNKQAKKKPEPQRLRENSLDNLFLDLNHQMADIWLRFAQLRLHGGNSWSVVFG